MSNPPKNVTLCQFFGFCHLHELIYAKPVITCSICPTIGIVMYLCLGQSEASIISAVPTRTFTASGKSVTPYAKAFLNKSEADSRSEVS